MSESKALKSVAALLRPVPDFPKPGILFWDIAPVLRDPKAMYTIIIHTVERWRRENIDVIAGFDARGFIFGQALATALNLPFEQIRKKGKLPGNVLSQAYALEYGEAEVEMLDDGFIAGKRVLLVDDLLATGGTALAGAQLVERLGGTVAGLTCVTELPALAGRSQLMHYPVYSLISVVDGKPEVDLEYCVDLLVFDRSSNDLLLIQRLNEPKGLAMPGGRIEHESLLAAGKRELVEETGCTFDPGLSMFHSVLCEPERDPRGLKVSYVLLVFSDIHNARGEIGKTEVLIFPKKEGLPDRSRFVLGHGDTVHAIADIKNFFGIQG